MEEVLLCSTATHMAEYAKVSIPRDLFEKAGARPGFRSASDATIYALRRLVENAAEKAQA